MAIYRNAVIPNDIQEWRGQGVTASIHCEADQIRAEGATDAAWLAPKHDLGNSQGGQEDET